MTHFDNELRHELGLGWSADGRGSARVSGRGSAGGSAPRAAGQGQGAHGAQNALVLGLHVRTDTNHPMYYFDQSHLVPERPEAFCHGDSSSLYSILPCLKSLRMRSSKPGGATPARATRGTRGGGESEERSRRNSGGDADTEAESKGAPRRGGKVILWATDNDVLAEPLLQRILEAEEVVVWVEHGMPSDRHDLNCWQFGCESSGLVDLEFLGLVKPPPYCPF